VRERLHALTTEHALRRGDPGRIHHAIEPTELAHRRLHRILHVGFAGHVRTHHTDAIAVCGRLLRIRLLVDVDDNGPAARRDDHVDRRATKS